jgi:hypothetical protein
MTRDRRRMLLEVLAVVLLGAAFFVGAVEFVRWCLS